MRDVRRGRDSCEFHWILAGSWSCDQRVFTFILRSIRKVTSYQKAGSSQSVGEHCINITDVYVLVAFWSWSDVVLSNRPGMRHITQPSRRATCHRWTENREGTERFAKGQTLPTHVERETEIKGLILMCWVNETWIQWKTHWGDFQFNPTWSGVACLQLLLIIISDYMSNNMFNLSSCFPNVSNCKWLQKKEKGTVIAM